MQSKVRRGELRSSKTIIRQERKSSSLKKVNQELLEQLRSLKERKHKNQDNQYDVVIKLST